MSDETVTGQAGQNTARNTAGLRPPWKPGESGNPGGRPKKKWLTEAIEELLEEKLADPMTRLQFKQAMWDKLMSNRVIGAMTLDRMLERTEGKVKETVEHVGAEGGPIQSSIAVRFVKPDGN